MRCDPRFHAVSNEIARILTAWDEDPYNEDRPWYSLSTDDIADLAALAALSAMPTREQP